MRKATRVAILLASTLAAVGLIGPEAQAQDQLETVKKRGKLIGLL